MGLKGKNVLVTGGTGFISAGRLASIILSQWRFSDINLKKIPFPKILCR